MKYPLRTVPCVNTIRALAKRFRVTGSVSNRKSNRQRRVLTEEKLDIAERLEHTLQKSIKHFAQETGIYEFSARNVT
ncbi:hypothetical protein C0J52_02391 [Blattella germanica]|nr:hypothetical protein C0J52_02391 [Blattella germanica]